MKAAEEYGCATPAKILSTDELDGRESFEPTPDAVAALDWVWNRWTGQECATARPSLLSNASAR